MKYCLTGIVLSFYCLLQHAIANDTLISNTYLGSREGDPASLVENVSAIHGDYTEVEVDLTVSSPDSLILSRFYSSLDSLQTANFGGWRFNPHCFLSVQKDPKEKPFVEGFERAYVYVGNPDGTILKYSGWQHPSRETFFKVDLERAGIANTAKGNISRWTNLNNNTLHYDPQSNRFELLLCTEGKRFYRKHPSLDIYFITHEILPSGNKVFYEFDEKGQLSFIKETNASEKKVLAWIKIEYSNAIRVKTSDGKSVEYHFQQDPSGVMLLNEVIRSHKPNLAYQYQVVGNQAFLTRKTLPDGHFVQVDYYTDRGQKNKVRSVTTPVGTGGVGATTLFSYGDNYTKVDGPGERKTVYQFDDRYQLVAIEQYLDGSLYRIHKKSWGIGRETGNLTSTSLEDAGGNVFYYKYFIYDSTDKGNIVEEGEYGDVIGQGAIPLIVDEYGLVTNQDGHIKNYSYFSGENTHGFFQTDAKGTGVKYWYKKGTNLLLKKFILTNGSPDSEEENRKSGIKERHFYSYNDDAALIRVIIDDGTEGILKDDDRVTERTITCISPKQELPNVGSPEVIEQKYSSLDGKSELLLKRTVNQFDEHGDIVSQAIYDSNASHCYTLTKGYKCGLLVFETDPLGNETRYSYDGNQNLILETHSDTGISIEYDYDLRNNLICTVEKDQAGNQFKTQVTYNPAGNKLLEIDRFGNETIYVNDSLGRSVQVTYPETAGGATYTYAYDLFDNPISVTDPKGRTLARSYNVHGKPIEISHLNGTKEVFRYDSGGNLHRYYGADGLLEVFAYDYKGRLNKLEHFQRGSKISNYPFKKVTSSYGAFHKTSETDARGEKTTYTYDHSGRLATISKGNQKIEFIYDSLGRTHGVKKWQSAQTFTLEIQEHDLLNRVIEERTEDETGKVLIKKRYVYNAAGQLAEVIGDPQNKESVLRRYEYDGFGRLCKTTDARGHATTIKYDDVFINEWGQKTRKRTLIDPTGNQTEEVLDIDNRLIKLTKKNTAGQVLADSESCYDSDNQISQKTLILSTSAPSNTYEIEWSLNQADQIESCTLGKGVSSARIVRYEYNLYGDISAKYNHGFKEPIIYRYNKEGNLETISYNEIDYNFSYDYHKNITAARLDSSFTISYSFDAHDLPLTETIQDQFGSYQIGRTYDFDGKILTLQFPDGSFVEYIYEGPFVKGARRFSKDKKELYNYQVTSRDLMGNIMEEILPGHLGERKQVWDEAGHRIEISSDFFQDRVGYDSHENIKKRETILDGEKYTTDYDYNALDQLILEKGKIEHKYAYDLIGNRLQRDNSTYKVDGINQLIDAEGATYTFNSNGNLATKTIGTKTWTYQSNYLNQIVSIEDPDQNVIKFTYDPNGKRLTKQIDFKSKKTKILRFFYLGDTEIGCVNENGVIIELKVPSNPNNPEAPSVAIEIKKEIYVPLYDLQGNIVCLLDHQIRKIVETYRYSVYGEEEVINESGCVISDSSLGNPWRYRGKRVDKEVGLIYFGYRYYDSSIGRWISPDPAGDIDGPNLYAYARNNPMKYVDYFGLNSEIDKNCKCVEHDHPGIHNAPKGCICICKKDGSVYIAESYRKEGTNIKSAIRGISHGVVDFAVGSLHDLHTAAIYIGSAELEIQERIQIIEAVEQSQVNQMLKVESWMIDLLSIDESDTVYHSFRSTTHLGLEVGSFVAGAYGVVKGVIGFSKLAKVPAIMVKSMRDVENVLKVGNFKYTNTAGKHINDIVKRGSFKGELSRPYMQSPLTINEIMAAGKPIPDPGGIPGGLRWDVSGTFRNSEGVWELVLHPETGLIYHFNFK